MLIWIKHHDSRGFYSSHRLEGACPFDEVAEQFTILERTPH